MTVERWQVQSRAPVAWFFSLERPLHSIPQGSVFKLAYLGAGHSTASAGGAGELRDAPAGARGRVRAAGAADPHRQAHLREARQVGSVTEPACTQVPMYLVHTMLVLHSTPSTVRTSRHICLITASTPTIILTNKPTFRTVSRRGAVAGCIRPIACHKRCFNVTDIGVALPHLPALCRATGSRRRGRNLSRGRRRPHPHRRRCRWRTASPVSTSIRRPLAPG